MLALGLATPWVEVGLFLPSVPMFLGSDLSAGFIKAPQLPLDGLVLAGDERRFKIILAVRRVLYCLF
jgi:hypothetical protein